MMPNRPLTWNTLKELLPFAILLISGGLSWGTLMTQQALTNQKLDTVIAQQDQISKLQQTETLQLNNLALTQTAHEVKITQLQSEIAPLLVLQR